MVYVSHTTTNSDNTSVSNSDSVSGSSNNDSRKRAHFKLLKFGSIFACIKQADWGQTALTTQTLLTKEYIWAIKSDFYRVNIEEIAFSCLA